MNIDDLIKTLFRDVATPDANSPGEMVRASLAGAMPGGNRPIAGPMPAAPVAPVQRSSMPAPMAVGAAQPAASPAPAPLRLNPLGSFARGYDSGGLLGAIANLSDEPALLDRQQQERSRQEAQAREIQNQTVQFLVSKKGMDPTQAALVARSPDVLQKYLAPADAQSANPETFGTTLNWTQDGRPYVVGNRGSMKFIETGDAKPMPPEELARARATGTLTGKTVAQAKLQLPQVLEKATNITAQLQSLEMDPHLPNMVGPVAGRQPNISADAERVQAKMDQITGAAFLQAFESLKGGGQITEIEGRKATEAITMLQNVRMKPDDYKAAIDALKKIVRNGVIRAKVDAGELPAEELNKLFDVEALNLPTIGNPNPRAPSETASQPVAGASGRSRIIGVQ